MGNTNNGVFKDDRGEIRDLLVTDEFSLTYITFKKGAVRGNHYHKKTTQIDFILKGSLVVGINSDRFVVNKREKLTHYPGEKHAYKALEDSAILSICFGVRKGTDYEKDTYRLKENERLL